MSRGLSLEDLPPELRKKVAPLVKRTPIAAVARLDARPHGMNKTEARRADYLDRLQRGGEIHDWRYEALNLRLGDNKFWKADFLVIGAHGEVMLEDVKGRSGDGPWVEEATGNKIYAAASMYPWFRFSIVWEAKGGIWQRREVRPC